MKNIGILLNKKKLAKPSTLDPETVFYVFRQIIKEEYGKQGERNIKPVFFKGGKIFLKAAGSTWTSEVLFQKKEITEKINERLGSREIEDLVMSD